MGALQKIRNQSTLLVVFIAIGLISFIVPWGEVMNFVNMKKDKAFVVDGEVIKTKEYADQIAMQQDMQEAVSGNLNEVQLSMLRENVYQSMVSEIVLDKQAKKIGLGITKEGFNNLLTNVEPGSFLTTVPYFVDRNTGQFSREALAELIKIVNMPLSSNAQMRSQQMQAGAIWDFISNKMKANALQDDYYTMLMRGIVVNNIELENYKNNNTPEANLAYVKLNTSLISNDEVKITKEDIKRLYDEKSKEIFLAQNPTKTLTYLYKEIVPSEDDYAEAKEEAENIAIELKDTTKDVAAVVNNYSRTPYLNAFVALNSIQNKEVKDFLATANVGDVEGPIEVNRGYNIYKYVAKTTAPDSIMIQLLPLPNMQALNQGTMQLADSLMLVANNGGNFNEMINHYYPGNVAMLQPQPITEEMLASVVDNASKIFNAPVGSVQQLTIQMTPALMKIVSKTKPVDKVKLAYIHVPVDISETTFNKVDNQINALITEVGKDVQNFDKAALAQGFDVREDVVIQPNYISINNIPSTRQIVRWAFDDRKSKSQLEKFDLPEGRIVALVTGSTKRGYLSVNDKAVDEALRSELMVAKKNEILEEKVTNMRALSLNQVAQAFNTNIDSVNFVTFNTTSVDYPLNVWSKVGKVGEVSKPLAGNQGVYVMDLVNQKPNPSTLDNKLIKTEVLKNYGLLNSDGIFLTQILTSKSKIEDNRVKFF